MLAGATNAHGHPSAPIARPAAAATPEPPTRASESTPEAPPTASEFADEFFSTANAYAVGYGHAVRLGRAHCVQASPGHYMCSYESRAPGRNARCHILQAQWTPDAESTFTVTLAGRAGRCESLRAALRSLR